MPVSARHLANLLPTSAGASGPTYRRLADGLRLLIIDGRLPSGTRLPSERALAEAMSVSRTTATAAYALLRERGYAHSRQGSGTEVRLPSSAWGNPAPGLTGPIMPGEQSRDLIDLATAAPPAPPGTAAAYQAAMESLPALLAGSGYHPLGLETLRGAVAARYTERGLPTSPDQIMITNGALSAVTLIAAELLRGGDRVVVENPTYPNTLEVLRSRRVRLLSVPVEPSGWDMDSLARTVRTNSPAMVLLTADFNNPTGALLTEEQRAEIAPPMAGVPLVVDETLVEFGVGQDVPPPMAHFIPHSILVGGASKSHWGGFRIGWIRVPDRELVPRLLDRLARRRLTVDLGVAPLEQTALAAMMADPGVVAHQRARVAAGRQAAVEAMTRLLPQWRIHRADGGLTLWCELPELNAVQTAFTAGAMGVRVAAGPRFAVASGFERFIRVSHVLDPAVVTTGIERLAAAATAPLVDTRARPRPILA